MGLFIPPQVQHHLFWFDLGCYVHTIMGQRVLVLVYRNSGSSTFALSASLQRRMCVATHWNDVTHYVEPRKRLLLE